MSRPDEGLIHQWLDGECTPEESARLEQLVATDPEWAAAVAEARGLIAASSRIVQSLDAVPRAMPTGSVAAPAAATAPAPQRYAAKRWMGLAAGLVLVAGTAYVMRERATEPFLPVATVDMPPPAPPPAGMTAEEMSRVEPPTTMPAIGPERTADRVLGGAGSGATQSAPAPLLVPEVDARKVAAEEEARGRVANAETQRRARLAVEAPRAASARVADAVSAAPAPSAPPVFLEGCWRVAAPPELAGVLNAPEIRRQRGDTLVLVTARGDMLVVRNGDTLQGELVARAEPCSE